MQTIAIVPQICDPLTGWTKFRPIDPEIFQHLSAAHGCPFLLSSATVNEESLCRISDTIMVDRKEVMVLQMSGNRPNIFFQNRIFKDCLSIG